MIRTISVLLATALWVGPAISAGLKQPSFMPSQAPVLQDTEAATGAMPAPPSAPMAMPAAPPAMSPQQMIDGLAAIKGSRDGSQQKLQTPRRVQRMLLRQAGKIGGGGTEDKNKGNLKQIANTGEFPYTTMGVIASGCSGTVVMKRFVLTAAWCVYDLKAKKFYENLNFFPAMNGRKTPFGEVQWKNAWVAQGFVDKGDLNFGYGLIELDQDIGDQTGWFGFGPVAKFNFKNLTITGYPFDGVPPQTMWESKCPVQGAEENMIFYRCPGNPKSLAAMLGSPIWFKGKADDAWQIVGIHVTAQNEKMDGWWAARLNAAHTATLINWANSATNPDPAPEPEEEETEEPVAGDEDEGGGTELVVDKPECTCDEAAEEE